MSVSCSFLAATKTDLDRLGFHFGKTFFAGYASMGAKTKPLTLSAYGPIGAGKTTFTTAFLNREKPFASLSPPSQDEKTKLWETNLSLPASTFTYCDFGARTLEFHLPSAYGLYETCNYKDSATPLPAKGLRLFEHAPLLYLLSSDLVLLMGNGRDPVETKNYYGTLEAFLRQRLRICQTPLARDSYNVFLRERKNKLESLIEGTRALRRKAQGTEKRVSPIQGLRAGTILLLSDSRSLCRKMERLSKILLTAPVPSPLRQDPFSNEALERAKTARDALEPKEP